MTEKERKDRDEKITEAILFLESEGYEIIDENDYNNYYHILYDDELSD